MSGGRMLMVGSCTGRKSVTHDRMLTMDDFRDPGRFRAREAELAACRVPAWRLYAGLQHTSMMNGLNTIRKRFGRESLAVAIVSAGYGLVAEDKPLSRARLPSTKWAGVRPWRGRGTSASPAT